MTNRLVNILTGCLFLCVVGGVSAAPGPNPSEGYHNYDAVTRQLNEWQKAHQEIASLQAIGKSAGGRDILVMTIAARGSRAPESRQAVFVGANIEGFHNSGTEAALDLIKQLLEGGDDAKLLETRTFYVAPILNPDAHDAFFGSPRNRIAGNATKLDRDMDGLYGEDGPNDLNADGIITKMRIRDPEGNMIPDPANPFEMKKADPSKGESGMYKVYTEGGDDDGDGLYNEDGPDGVQPGRNFAHAFEYGRISSGIWAGYAPEARSIMDFMLARRNIALAVIYGSANNFLAPPQSLGGGSDTGSIKFELPKDVAEYLGLDPNEKHSLDAVWEVAKNMPIVIQNNLTKDDVAQFLGVGPATKPTDDDLKLISYYADKYKERLEKAGLDNKRKGEQYVKGGLTPWIYYQYGAMAVELDVWGIPKPKEEKKADEGDKLTIDKLEKMSSDDFVALGEEKIAQFMKENKVPEQYTPAAVIGMVKAGQIDPPKIAGMLKSMGAGADKKDAEGPGDIQQFISANAPQAGINWTPVKLADGTEVEVGGFDPFVTINPPQAMLADFLKTHTQTVLELAADLATLAIVDTSIENLGGDVYRIKITAANQGQMPSHSGLDQKGKFHLPVRLGLDHNEKVQVLHGPKWATSEQLEGKTGTMTGEWLVKAARGSKLKALLLSDHAGSDSKDIQL